MVGATRSDPRGTWPATLALRLVLVAAAAALVVGAAPAGLRATTGVAAALAAAGPLLARRGRGLGDAAALAAGGLVLALLAVGLVLDLLPAGITRTSWGYGAGVLELAAVAATARAVLRLPRPGRAVLGALLWSLPVLAVVAAAIMVSTRATDADQQSPLELAAVGDPRTPTLVLTSSTADGPFDLTATSRGRSTVVATGLRVGPGAVARHSVQVRKGVRTTVVLTRTGTAAPLRTVVLQP